MTTTAGFFPERKAPENETVYPKITGGSAYGFSQIGEVVFPRDLTQYWVHVEHRDGVQGKVREDKFLEVYPDHPYSHAIRTMMAPGGLKKIAASDTTPTLTDEERIARNGVAETRLARLEANLPREVTKPIDGVITRVIDIYKTSESPRVRELAVMVKEHAADLVDAQLKREQRTINQRDMALELVRRLGVNLKVIDPKVACDGPQLIAAMEVYCDSLNDLPEVKDERWRVGNHYNIHVYEGEKPVATFRYPEDALEAVEAVNTERDETAALKARQDAEREGE